ncbi:MAG: hypothetical protein WCO35_03300 [Candidatus Nomurabacteria bacterium]
MKKLFIKGFFPGKPDTCLNGDINVAGVLLNFSGDNTKFSGHIYILDEKIDSYILGDNMDEDKSLPCSCLFNLTEESFSFEYAQRFHVMAGSGYHFHSHNFIKKDKIFISENFSYISRFDQAFGYKNNEKKLQIQKESKLTLKEI